MSERPELEFWVLEEQYQALGELRGEPLSGTEETRSPVLLFRLPISCESRKDRPHGITQDLMSRRQRKIPESGKWKIS